MSNLRVWDQVAEVPQNAQKKISGGRLSGMTDINPVWRLKKLTEIYGPCGFGWYYEVINKSERQVENGEVLVFVDISLYVKDKDSGEWSKPIHGTGGNKLATKENKGMHYSDEAYKMAETDAISVACKSLGFGSNVYWSNGKSKYSPNGPDYQSDEQQGQQPPKQQKEYTADSVFAFGKYKGKSFGQVYKENPSYFEYLSQKSSDVALKEFSRKLFEHYKNTNPVEEMDGNEIPGA